ncbi:hypothetical protein VO178_09670 [Lysinibacillus fusiformis]|uniref:hypothetical protein n=1 Tax=Lysinibacillus fusiformis TaxID=28031 RepID=UPI002D7710F3|nr:hypothetical protein [Lysinibacillus fusiformis]WRS99942.1 hypothetical protein VO178_09670 [Lysinibacillus fusiformis]
MAEHFSFFDPVQLPDGTYDREYNAQQFTDYFNTLVTTGVMKGVGNQLVVSANGSNMITKIDTGIAFVEAKYYKNDSFKELTHDTESLGVSRIDRIVIRMDLSTDKRHVLSFVKKGTPSANPVPPTLTQTQTVYEISLAQVKIVGGQTFIATNAITDERGTSVICPWAGSNILPSFDDNALAQHITDKNVHIQSNERTNWNNKLPTFASPWQPNLDPNTHTDTFYVSDHPNLGGGYWYVENRWYGDKSNGILMQVATSYTGPPDQKVRRKGQDGNWTPWSPSFQSVSDGKTKIAAATTDQGVPTSPTATFDQMAANIRAINTGKKFATGGATLIGGTSISVSTLAFRPKTILVRKGTAAAGWIGFSVYTDNLSPVINANVDVNGVNQQVPVAGNFSIINNGFTCTVSQTPYSNVIDWIAFE